MKGRTKRGVVDGVRFTLRELAETLGAVLEGNPDVTIAGVAPLDTAEADHIALLANTRHRAAAMASRAGAFLAPVGGEDLPAPVLRVPAPHLAFITLLDLFYPPEPHRPGVHRTAVIAPDATVDPTAQIGAFVVVEAGAVVGTGVRLLPYVYVGADTEIGAGSVLHPHVVVYARVVIGRRVIIHAGTVVGADGFGYVSEGDTHRKIPQVGRVRIEDDVEVGANTTIDRATIGDTVIERGTKIDNLVQIAHNVYIGAQSLLAAQVGIAGSARLGRQTVLAGQVGVGDHATLSDNVIIGAQSGVISSIERPGAYLGSPARPAAETRRIVAALSRLPELVRRLRAVERRVEAIGAEPRGEASEAAPE